MQFNDFKTLQGLQVGENMSDCEIPQYYFCKDVTARKEHKCCECDARILIGEKHLRVNACWDSRPETYRQHHLCQQACELVRDSGINDDECVYYGGLWEYWAETRNELYSGKKLEARQLLWRLMLRIKRRERKDEKAA